MPEQPRAFSVGSGSLVTLLALVAGAAVGAAATAVALRKPSSSPSKLRKDAKYKVFYFDFAGKGEPIRLALTYAGIAFDDMRVQSAEWVEKWKPKMKFGQMPCLLVDGEELVQTVSILRAIGKSEQAREAGLDLYPEDVLVAAKIDALCDLDADCFTGLKVQRYKARHGFKPELLAPIEDEVKAALVGDVIPRHLRFVEAALAESKTGWLAGTKGPSIADFLWAGDLEWVDGGIAGTMDINLDEFPKCRELVRKFKAQPFVRKWAEIRGGV